MEITSTTIIAWCVGMMIGGFICLALDIDMQIGALFMLLGAYFLAMCLIWL